MKLYFCDLCNESVPHSDLEVGKAFIRKSRVVCASCDEAMSAALASQGTPSESGGASSGSSNASSAGHSAHAASSAKPPSATGTKRASSSLGAVGLWIGLIALFLAAGTLMYTLQEIEKSRIEFAAADDEAKAQASEAVAAAEERARSERAGLRESARGIDGRIDAQRTELLAKIDETTRALEGINLGADTIRADLSQLSKTVSEKIGLQDGQLQSFDGELQRYEEEIRFFGERLNELEVGVLTKEFIASAEKSGAPAEPKDGAAWASILPDLKSKESGDRWAAVQALGETADLGVVEHLIPVLQDIDIFVRMATARVLGDLKARTAIPHLINALEDVEVAVQEAAVGSLRLISGRNFGFEIEANEKDRAKRIKAWRTWWNKSQEDAAPAGS